MTGASPGLHVDALRRAFDDSFAADAEAGAGAAGAVLLAIRLRGDPHLLRLADVRQLLRAGPLVRYPSPAPAWLGLAGVAGEVLPVYDLGALAGHPPADAPGWLAVCAAAPVALAFDGFDGQVRAILEPDADAAGAGDARPRGVAHVAGAVRPIVDVAAILDTLRGASGAGNREN